ncbi:MAG: 5'-deoxyadenosine deaminase [Planctomycetes bacterium]|nr:5'-deoxyadenosine deaminase [Planctomycetota bacterium]
MAILIEDAWVVTMDADRRVVRGSVLVEGGRIAAVGEVDPSETEGPAVERIAAGGRVLLPGLVQTHVHLCQTLFRNQADDLELLDWLSRRIWPMEAAHDEASVRASARLGIAELLKGGTTTVLDMGTVRHTGVIFEEARRMGIRGAFGKVMMDHPECPEGLREPTDEVLAECASLAERWHGQAGGRLRYAYAPRFAVSCTEGLLRETARLARRGGCLVHTHASENRKELELVRRLHGRGNIELLGELGLLGPDCCIAHCVHVTERDMDRLRDSGSHVLHCPSSNLKLASGVAPVPEMRLRGISVSLGADGAPCNNNLDMFTEMRQAALVQKVRLGPTAMPAAEVVAMATVGGARALGLAGEVGSIEPGKRADLILVDLERLHSVPGNDLYGRLVYSARATDVVLTMVDGRVVARDGMLLVDDEADVVRTALREAEALTRRVA